MKVDPALSRYHESLVAPDEWEDWELKNCRFLLRRLRFLEDKARRTEKAELDASGGSMFVEKERDALAFLLTEVGFLETRPATREER